MRLLLPTLGLLALLWPSGGAMASWHEDAPAFGGQMRNFATLRNPRPAPDFVFTGPNGDSLTLADFRGKVVLLNFWATWCPPCVAEMPSLNRLQSQLGGDRFEVLALSLDESRVIVDRFFDEFRIAHLGVYRDTGERRCRSLQSAVSPPVSSWARKAISWAPSRVLPSGTAQGRKR